jgi:formylglycine-generating enzyme required for sulfatase activity
MTKLEFSILMLAALLAVSTSAARAKGLDIETVPVGAPANSADPVTGYGAVAYAFRIARSETTLDQYVAFLNAVADVPPNEVVANLWSKEMSKEKEDPGPLILRSGAGTPADPYRYTVAPSKKWGPRAGLRPVPWVSWYDAARFANWMHNGGTKGANTEDGAYSLTEFQTRGAVSRNPDARWWIPSEDEWYKAAYFDPHKPGGADYWTYPTRSDGPPRDEMTPDVHGEPSTRPLAPAANFNETYKPLRRTKGGVLTPICAYADDDVRYDSRGPWGTCDQAGSLWEWTEAIYAGQSNHIVRGGSWGGGLTPPKKTVRRDYGPMGSAGSFRDDDTGFRLATRP